MTTDQKPDKSADGMSAEDLVLRLLTGSGQLTPEDAQRLLTGLRADWTGHGTPALAVREGEADVLQLPVSRGDLRELAAVLTAERYRLDRGDDSPVPQPRWAANVRISQAVYSALASSTGTQKEAVQGGARRALARMLTPGLGVMSDREEEELLDAYRAEVLHEAPGSEPARPGSDYSAVYLDQHDRIWSDYPVLPPSDLVLPMVWADEQARSKADLVDAGTELRIIGWVAP